MIKSAQEIRNEMYANQEYMAKINAQIEDTMKRIEQAKSRGERRACWTSYYEDEVKQMFLEKGYTFKPTGYCGGVWQLTTDICW